MKISFMTLMFFMSVNCWAAQGHDQGGGGDLCEDRIKIIRDDFKQWIANGGPEGLSLPEDVTVQQYSDSMLQQMAGTKIRCVAEGDKGYPVVVHGAAKTCRFDISGNQKMITCDFTKFQSMDDSDQYVLIHHEYAGLAGLEVPDKEDSVYTLSNQISGYLENQIVKKLVVKNGQKTGLVMSPWDPQYTAGAPLKKAQIIKAFPAGETNVAYGVYTIFARHRSCHPVTGCKEWTSLHYTMPASQRAVEAKILDAQGNIQLNIGTGNSQCVHRVVDGSKTFNCDMLALVDESFEGFKEALGTYKITSSEIDEKGFRSRGLGRKTNDDSTYSEVEFAIVGSLGLNYRMPIDPDFFPTSGNLRLACTGGSGDFYFDATMELSGARSMQQALMLKIKTDPSGPGFLNGVYDITRGAFRKEETYSDERFQLLEGTFDGLGVDISFRQKSYNFDWVCSGSMLAKHESL